MTWRVTTTLKSLSSLRFGVDNDPFSLIIEAHFLLFRGNNWVDSWVNYSLYSCWQCGRGKAAGTDNCVKNSLSTTFFFSAARQTRVVLKASYLISSCLRDFLLLITWVNWQPENLCKYFHNLCLSNQPQKRPSVNISF